MAKTESHAAVQPGRRIRVVQRVMTREGPWATDVEGVVVSRAPRPTGSWFAHGKNDRLWLDRVRLRKDDGELVDLILDEGSEVNVLGDATAPAS